MESQRGSVGHPGFLILICVGLAVVVACGGTDGTGVSSCHDGETEIAISDMTFCVPTTTVPTTSDVGFNNPDSEGLAWTLEDIQEHPYWDEYLQDGGAILALLDQVWKAELDRLQVPYVEPEIVIHDFYGDPSTFTCNTGQTHIANIAWVCPTKLQDVAEKENRGQQVSVADLGLTVNWDPRIFLSAMEGVDPPRDILPPELGEGLGETGDILLWVFVPHEWGHVIQWHLIAAGRESLSAPLGSADVEAGKAVELQADCLAGFALARAVDEDLMRVEPGDLDEMTAALYYARDRGAESHGTSLERASAFLAGWDTAEADPCYERYGSGNPTAEASVTTLPASIDAPTATLSPSTTQARPSPSSTTTDANIPTVCPTPYPIDQWDQFAGITLPSYRFPDGEQLEGGIFRVLQRRGDLEGYPSIQDVGPDSWLWIKSVGPIPRRLYRSVVVSHDNRYYVVEAKYYEPWIITTTPPITVVPNSERAPCSLPTADAGVYAWYACTFHNDVWYWVHQLRPDGEVQQVPAGDC